jgi:hypothetical protein
VKVLSIFSGHETTTSTDLLSASCNTGLGWPPDFQSSPTTSRVDPTTNRVDTTTSKLDTTTSTVDLTTSRVDPTTSRVDPPTSKIDITTSKVDPTTSRVDPTISRVDPTISRVDPTTRLTTAWPDITKPYFLVIEKPDKNVVITSLITLKERNVCILSDFISVYLSYFNFSLQV